MRLGVTDLKSAPRKGVWVRLPSSAPTQRSQCTEDAREPRSPARIFRGNVSLLTGLDRRTRLKTKPGGGPGGPFFDPGGRSLRSVTNRVGLSRNGLCPQWFFSRATQKRTEGTPPMKGILIRAATVVLGVSASVGLGIALASAG